MKWKEFTPTRKRAASLFMFVSECMCACAYPSIKHQFPNKKLKKGGEILSPCSTHIRTWFSPELIGDGGSITGSSEKSREEHTRRKARPKD